MIPGPTLLLAMLAMLAIPVPLASMTRVTIQDRYDAFMPESCQSHPVVVKRDSQVTNVGAVDKGIPRHTSMGLGSSEQFSSVYAEATQ